MHRICCRRRAAQSEKKRKDKDTKEFTDVNKLIRYIHLKKESADSKLDEGKRNNRNKLKEHKKSQVQPDYRSSAKCKLLIKVNITDEIISMSAFKKLFDSLLDSVKYTDLLIIEINEYNIDKIATRLKYCDKTATAFVINETELKKISSESSSENKQELKNFHAFVSKELPDCNICSKEGVYRCDITFVKRDASQSDRAISMADGSTQPEMVSAIDVELQFPGLKQLSSNGLTKNPIIKFEEACESKHLSHKIVAELQSPSHYNINKSDIDYLLLCNSLKVPFREQLKKMEPEKKKSVMKSAILDNNVTLLATLYEQCLGDTAQPFSEILNNVSDEVYRLFYRIYF